MELKRIENNFDFYHGCGMYHLDGSNVLMSLPCNKIKKELIEYNLQTFHSSDSDSDSDTDSSLNSEESMYNSDSNDLIIDETTN